MDRKLIVGLVVVLVFGSVVTAVPATAKKGRGKPVSFEAEGSVLLSNPNDATFLGATRAEFESNCAVPSNTQGLDGYVIELPPQVTRVNSMVYIEGTNATGLTQLDLFFFDLDCTELGHLLAFEDDVPPVMPRGTKFVFVRNWIGDPVDFVFHANEDR